MKSRFVGFLKQAKNRESD